MNSKKSEKMERENEAKQFYAILEKGMTFFDSITDYFCKNSRVFRETELRNILTEFYHITQEVIEKNPGVIFQNAFHMHYLSSKLELHNITKSYFELLKFAKENFNDTTLEKILANNKNGGSQVDGDIEEKLNQNLARLSEPVLPENWENIEKDYLQTEMRNEMLKQNLHDYVFKLEQIYEVFVALSMFLLMNCYYMIGKPIDKIGKALKDKEKYATGKLFTTKNENQGNKCLNQLLNKDLELFTFLKFVFDKKGVREIRNLLTHHLGEKDKCEFMRNGLKFTFSEGQKQFYNIREIQAIYGKMVVVSNVLYFIILRQQLHALDYFGKMAEKNPAVLKGNDEG